MMDLYHYGTIIGRKPDIQTSFTTMEAQSAISMRWPIKNARRLLIYKPVMKICFLLSNKPRFWFIYLNIIIDLLYINNSCIILDMQPQDYKTPFDWKKDKDKPTEQLFLRAFLYCTQYLTLSKGLFSGEHELFGQYKSAINLSGGQ